MTGTLKDQALSTVTHVLMVIDMSGSMSDLAADVRGGYNSYLASLKDDGEEYRLTVTVFDTEFIPIAIDMPLATVPELTFDNYVPRGMTALYDAIGKTFGDFQTKHGTVGVNERALMVIQTDGAENSSREFDRAKIRKLIGDREATGRWAFIYMGAGPTAWLDGGQIGLGKYSMATRQDSAGVGHTYSGLTGATIAYAAGASRGETFSRAAAEAADEDAAAQAARATAVFDEVKKKAADPAGQAE